MLRFIRVVGITLVSMLTLGGVASAHEFQIEKAGAVTRVTNKTQIFATGSVTVECKVDTFSNANFVEVNRLNLLADVSYSSCDALGASATVSTAKYLFSADNLVKLENTVVIKGALGCVITVKPQHFATGITYKNSGKDIVIEPNISGIASEGEGGLGLCKNSTTGTYAGTTEVQSVGQSIKWA